MKRIQWAVIKVPIGTSATDQNIEALLSNEDTIHLSVKDFIGKKDNPDNPKGTSSQKERLTLLLGDKYSYDELDNIFSDYSWIIGYQYTRTIKLDKRTGNYKVELEIKFKSYKVKNISSSFGRAPCILVLERVSFNENNSKV